MKDLKLHNPRIERYQEKLRRNPYSKVFAPLADIYRKLGLYDKAFKVLKEGTRLNPSYFPGYLSLSFCYFDKGYYDSAYFALRPFLNSYKDNVAFIKLLSRIYIKLDMTENALETLRHLLRLNPRDDEAKEQIMKLEEPLEQALPPMTSFNVDNISGHPEGCDVNRWKQLDFNSPNNEVLSTIFTRKKEKLILFLRNVQEKSLKISV